MNQLKEFFTQVFRHHKLKILAFFAMTLLFFLILFPTNDLSDFVTTTVSNQTNRQVYLQFDELGFTLFPKPGIGFEKVYLESALAPAMNIGALTVSPSITSLLSFRRGFTSTAEDFLGGEVFAAWEEGEESAKGAIKQNIDIELEGVRLAQILSLIEAPVQLNGSVEGETSAVIDPTFGDQPEGELEFEVEKFRFPASPIPTPMGAFPLPEIRISKVDLEGRLTAGEFFVDQLKIGNSKDQINGQIKGKMRLRINRRGVQIQPQPGRFEFDIDIKVLPQMQKELQLVLGLLDAYKRPGIGHVNYCLKVSGRNFFGPPKMEPQSNCQ